MDVDADEDMPDANIQEQAPGRPDGQQQPRTPTGTGNPAILAAAAREIPPPEVCSRLLHNRVT